jgi:multiple sugar transport system ATP-binding protein
MSEVEYINIKKNFGSVEVLKDINLNIGNQKFVVLLGPSGCGKTTLLRMTAGLETISSGEISIGGDIINNIHPRDRDIAMVFQNYALYPQMNVFDNIAFSLQIRKMASQEIKEKVEWAASVLNLTDFLNRTPKELSGGQRQRVAMGRALVRDPKVFLFDEPLSNLDAKLRAHMRLEIRKLHNQQNATTIYVTHDQIEAMTMADEIVIMNNGIIEQIATPNEIYEKPNNLFVADFIGTPAINLLEGVVTDTSSIKLKSQDIPHSKKNVSNNQNVVYGIRPTDVSIDPSSNIKAEVVLVETTGSETHIIAMLDDNEFRVVQNGGRTTIKNGDVIPLSINIEKAHLFDHSSTKRID